MTRRMSFHPEGPSISQIWSYYTHVRGSLDNAWRSSLRGEPGRFHGLPPSMQGLSLDEAFEFLISELENEVTMALSSSFEAHLRIDFYQRVYEKRKDDISRAFREIYKNDGTHIRLADILDIWRDVGSISKMRISGAKQLVDYRHWLAHGRYWIFKSRYYDPEEALSVIDMLFDELKLRSEFVHYR